MRIYSPRSLLALVASRAGRLLSILLILLVGCSGSADPERSGQRLETMGTGDERAGGTVHRLPESEFPLILEGLVGGDEWRVLFDEQQEVCLTLLLFDDEEPTSSDGPGARRGCARRPVSDDRRWEPIEALTYRLSADGVTAIVVGALSTDVESLSVRQPTHEVVTGFDAEHGVFVLIFDSVAEAQGIELVTADGRVISCDVVGGQLRDLGYLC